MSFKDVGSLLRDANPETYNFEFEFDIHNYDRVSSAWDRYFVYRAYAGDEQQKSQILSKNKIDKYHEPGHLDGSDGKCKLILEIYSKLWRWKRNQETNYGFFRIIENYGNLFGGDTINSLQTIMNYCLKKTNKRKCSMKDYLLLYCNNSRFRGELKESFPGLECFMSIYHTVGNFVLVPAYFNAGKGGYDFFDAGLYKLQQEGWNISDRLSAARKITWNKKKTNGLDDFLKSLGSDLRCEEYPSDEQVLEIKGDIRKRAKKKYKNFSSKDFNKYINTMFLWDYTFADLGEKRYIVKSLCRGDWSEENDIAYNEKIECCRTSDNMKEEEINNFISNAQYAIKRRSLFMVAMLRIARIPEIYEDIVEKIFLKDEPYSNGYWDAIKRIREVTGDNAVIKVILNQLEGSLESIRKTCGIH